MKRELPVLPLQPKLSVFSYASLAFLIDRNDSLLGADVDAHTAVDTQLAVDLGPLVLLIEVQGRAFEMIDAVAAAVAVVCYLDLDLLAFQSFRITDDTAPPGNDHSDSAIFALRVGMCFFEKADHLFHIIGIDVSEPLYAASLNQLLQRDLPSFGSISCDAYARCRLHPGHGRNFVV